VVLTVCVLVIVWLLVSHWKTRRSLRWWQSRQASHEAEAAELIRDGLLQEAFSLRRTLELALNHSTHPSQQVNQELLTTFERFHHELKELSDRLSPAYVDSNLPLAIQHLLERWQTSYPGLGVEADLASDWPDATESHNRLVLMAMNELLRITLPEAGPEPFLSLPSISVSLQEQAHANELILHLTDINQQSNPSISQDLTSLEQSFCLLMPGHCKIKHKQGNINCKFQWKY
jgi:hypothetical protein